MSADGLARDLAELGVACRVETFDRLAVIAGPASDVFADRGVRQRIRAAARANGFTHVALELESDAPVPGD